MYRSYLTTFRLGQQRVLFRVILLVLLAYPYSEDLRHSTESYNKTVRPVFRRGRGPNRLTRRNS